MKITEKLKDKNVLIWGYGKEGKSTERFINSFCSVKNLTIFEGKESEIEADKYDYIIKSPGIRVDNYLDNFTSQTELFLEEFASQTIGITGTKGKSTTSSMLYEVLSASLKRKVLLVGNIGLPCLDYYGEIDADTIIVFEMSCHQLSNICYSPHIAVFLNLFEDHLDYYGTREKYFQAKANIVSHQKENDVNYCGETVPEIPSCSKKIVLSYEDAMPFEMRLKGQHNQFNANFVYHICVDQCNCDESRVREAIKVFKGLSHRLEYVAQINGVDFYNDSISTIPEATVAAIKSVTNTKTVILGGMDRHIHYDVIIEFIKNNQDLNYILSYESGLRIFQEVGNLDCCVYKNDLKESVAYAKEITPAGKACLFSPAAASYGYFKNFEERGDVYKQLVLQEG